MNVHYIGIVIFLHIDNTLSQLTLITWIKEKKQNSGFPHKVGLSVETTALQQFTMYLILN